VIRIVGMGHQASAIDPKQIDDIRLLLSSGIPVTMYPFLRVGNRIRVRGGCLEGVEGILESNSDQSTLVISVNAIQRSIAVSLAGYRVEPM
jgi:hypothetical protein